MIEKFEKQYKDDSPFERKYEIEKRFSIDKNHDDIYAKKVNLTEPLIEIEEKPIEKVESESTKRKAKRVPAKSNKTAMASIQKKVRKG